MVFCLSGPGSPFIKYCFPIPPNFLQIRFSLQLNGTVHTQCVFIIHVSVCGTVLGYVVLVFQVSIAGASWGLCPLRDKVSTKLTARLPHSLTGSHCFMRNGGNEEMVDMVFP